MSGDRPGSPAARTGSAQNMSPHTFDAPPNDAGGKRSASASIAANSTLSSPAARAWRAATETISADRSAAATRPCRPTARAASSAG